MTIPLVPFEGRMSYCLTKCLQMVLAHRGDAYALSWLEYVSGEPFGFVYGRGEHFFFAVNGYPYHLAGEHLLRTLDYAYTYTSSADATTALVALKDALQAGPVVAGMLDMGFLTYIPNHHQLHGSDKTTTLETPYC
jgi:hypothetical protein